MEECLVKTRASGAACGAVVVGLGIAGVCPMPDDKWPAGDSCERRLDRVIEKEHGSHINKYSRDFSYKEVDSMRNFSLVL